jgi:hypothetical protein
LYIATMAISECQSVDVNEVVAYSPKLEIWLGETKRRVYMFSYLSPRDKGGYRSIIDISSLDHDELSNTFSLVNN